MESILDLRDDGQLSAENAKSISLIATDVRSEYNKYVADLVKANNIEGMQFFLKATCRDTGMSRTLDRFYRIALLELKLKEGVSFDCIVTSSKSVAFVVRQLLTNYKSCANIQIESSQNSLLMFIMAFLKNIYRCFNHWFWPKIFRFKIELSEPIVLLDTFLSKDSFNKNLKLNDRYFPGLVDHFRERDSLYYLPTLSKFKYPWEWFKFFQDASRTTENILLKENYLKFVDYLSAIWKSITLPKVIKKIPEWRGLNVSKIVLDDIQSDRFSFSITQAVLIYYSFKRYQEQGLLIRGVIDWFENQVIDRSLILGVKHFYSDVYIKGYMGFVVSENFAATAPMDYEYNGNVLPHEILVMGDAYISEKKKSCSKLKVSTAPAFRLQNALKFHKKQNKNKNIVLLVMPIAMLEAEEIINFVLKSPILTKYKLMIKIHPTYSKEEFVNLVPDSLNGIFSFYDGDLVSISNEVSFVLTSVSTSAVIEFIVCKVPVVIIGIGLVPVDNLLFGVLDRKYWNLVYKKEDLNELILNGMAFSKVKPNYLAEEVTTNSVNTMMNFNNYKKL